MGDRWNPENLIDSRYIWVPLTLEGDQPVITWRDSWNYADEK